MIKWAVDIFLLILKPIIGSAKELKNEIRSVRKNLHLYARQISNPGMMENSEIEQASCAIRLNASNLLTLTDEVKYFSFLAFLHIVPDKVNIIRASELLTGLSSSLGYIPYNNTNLNDGTRNCEKSDEIKQLLSIKPDLCERFSSWIVFILVAIGGYSLVNFIASSIQKLIGK